MTGSSATPGHPPFVVPTAELRDTRAGGSLVVGGAEAHHAVQVRRIRPGQPVELTDGCGRLARGRVLAAEHDRLVVDVRDVVDLPPAQPRLVVVQAIPKGERAERAVELMTEVGVDVVVPWAASRCVVRWSEERATAAVGKWQRASVAAAKQSRRWWFPVICPATETSEVCELVGSAALAVLLDETAREPLTALPPPVTGTVLLAVGPEGGITDDERQLLHAAGARSARLGPTVLRTSTAGGVAAALVLSRTSRWRDIS